MSRIGPRNRSRSTAPGTEFLVGHWLVQPELGVVRSRDRKVTLDPKVMDVLVFLAEHPGRVLSKERILNHVWPNSYVGEGVLTHAIFDLRKAFEDDARNPAIIETLPRRGYRLIAAVADDPSRTPRHVGPGRRRRLLSAFALLSVSLTLAVGVGLWHFRGESWSLGLGHVESLAVLPFANLSSDPEQEYFADGMTGALITELGRTRSLRVISRQSVIRLKGTASPVSDLAGQLDVDAIVNGTVFRDGNRVRITVELLATSPERHLWSGSYERNLNDVLALQRELARDIRKQIGIALALDEPMPHSDSAQVDPEAYEAYLFGRYFWRKWTPEGMEKSAELFRRAIALDEDYASAWAGLSMSYRFPAVMGVVPASERLPLAKHAASRAVELDPNLAEAYASLGVSDCYDWNWIGCEQNIRKALELNPSYAQGHHIYAIAFLLPMGRVDQAIEEIELARKLEPLSLVHKSMLGQLLYYGGKYEQSIEQLTETIELEPDFAMAYLYLGKTYRELGKFAEALEAHEKAVSISRIYWALGELGYTYAVSGNRVRARSLLANLIEESRSTYVSPTAIAVTCLGLGEIDQTFEWLGKSVEDHDPMLIWFQVEPRSEALRDDPRFQQLLRTLNLNRFRRHR